MNTVSFRCDKIVRAQDPTRMQDRGIQTITKTLDPAYLAFYLGKKMAEEVQEVREYMAKDRSKALDELTDVFQAMQDLLTTWGISTEEFHKMVQEKKQARGAYIQGTYLDSITLAQDQKDLAHYQHHPDRYPVIP